MIIKNENFDEGVKVLIEQAAQILKEEGRKLAEKANEYVPLVEDMISNLKGDIEGIAYGEEVETVDVKTIAKFAKKYMVNGSNNVAVCKQHYLDGYYLYLAYAKDKELLPIKENAYVIIKAQTLTKDVEDLFGDSSVVIIN